MSISSLSVQRINYNGFYLSVRKYEYLDLEAPIGAVSLGNQYRSNNSILLFCLCCWGNFGFMPVAFLNKNVTKCRICGFTWQAKCWEEYSSKPNGWPEVVHSYRKTSNNKASNSLYMFWLRLSGFNLLIADTTVCFDQLVQLVPCHLLLFPLNFEIVMQNFPVYFQF